LAKTQSLLQELETEAPLLSKDLKIKIVKAILEEDQSNVDEEQSEDSEEGNITNLRKRN